MDNYISRSMNYGNKVVGIVEMYKDFQAKYNKNFMPKDVHIEDNKSEVKV